MDIKTKYSIGQDVVLFNGVAMQMEHDEVFAILLNPVPTEGNELDPRKPVSESLNEGVLEVKPQYQLQHHQGLLDEKLLFGSEEACKEFFREFFS